MRFSLKCCMSYQVTSFKVLTLSLRTLWNFKLRKASHAWLARMAWDHRKPVQPTLSMGLKTKRLAVKSMHSRQRLFCKSPETKVKVASDCIIVISEASFQSRLVPHLHLVLCTTCQCNLWAVCMMGAQLSLSIRIYTIFTNSPSTFNFLKLLKRVFVRAQDARVIISN